MSPNDLIVRTWDWTTIDPYHTVMETIVNAACGMVKARHISRRYHLVRTP